MPKTYGRTTALSVSLNGQRLGLISGLRERVQRELLPVTSRGLGLPATMVVGKTQIVLTLKRLVPMLPDRSAQTLLDTHSFTLQISDGTSTVSYGGCEVAAMTACTELGEYRLEEIEIRASSGEELGA